MLKKRLSYYAIICDDSILRPKLGHLSFNSETSVAKNSQFDNEFLFINSLISYCWHVAFQYRTVFWAPLLPLSFRQRKIIKLSFSLILIVQQCKCIYNYAKVPIMQIKSVTKSILKSTLKNQFKINFCITGEALHPHTESNPFPCQAFLTKKWLSWNPAGTYGAAKSGWACTTKTDPDR